jgi:hypothetical protein
LQGFGLGCSIAGEMNRIVFVLMIAASLKVSGQTVTNENETITVTNWVKPGPFLRIVDGVTYSVAFSKKWAKFSDWERLGQESLDSGDNGDTSHLVLGNYQIIGNVTFITILREHFHHQPDALPYKSYDEPDHVVALLNCEHPNQTEFYCMKTKDILDGKGVAFRAYDCGIQATNLVPVIEKVKVKKPKQN